MKLACGWLEKDRKASRESKEKRAEKKEKKAREEEIQKFTTA